jgi:hypothetical protein
MWTTGKCNFDGTCSGEMSWEQLIAGRNRQVELCQWIRSNRNRWYIGYDNKIVTIIWQQLATCSEHGGPHTAYAQLS